MTFHCQRLAKPLLTLCTSLLISLSASVLAADKPNILVIMGDDIGITNISKYSHGMMGYPTPNIDRIANEGMMFTDYLRQDPFERADTDSNGYNRWWDKKIAARGIPGAILVRQFLATFEEFPPRQRPASFTIDQEMEKFQQEGAKRAGKP